jgi:hypothetical protein
LLLVVVRQMSFSHKKHTSIGICPSRLAHSSSTMRCIATIKG